MTLINQDGHPEVTGARETRLVRMLEMHRRLADSAWIPRLHDDWDGEGSRGYALATWWRAYKLVINWWAEAIERDLDIGLPQVAPADNGTVDITWRRGARTLLVNLSPDEADTYAGLQKNADPGRPEDWICGRWSDTLQAELTGWLHKGASNTPKG